MALQKVQHKMIYRSRYHHGQQRNVIGIVTLFSCVVKHIHGFTTVVHCHREDGVQKSGDIQ